MKHVESMPRSMQWHYAIGQLGWSTLINIINLQLVYFYLPPEEANIPLFISQIVFLGVMNAITIIAASGRVIDAFTDPIIANWSDRFSSDKGRRLPFMKWSALPAAVFCALLFFPIVGDISSMNIIWLFVVQALFYISLTFYVTPYFALIPEFGHSPKLRLNLSTYISITYALGIVFASQVPTIGAVLGGALGMDSVVQQIQLGVIVLSVLAVIFMLWPVIKIDENKYSRGEQSEVKVWEALKTTFANRYFRYYVAADFAYFTGLTIVMTGLLYFITVLLELDELMMGILLPLMVVSSFFFYPLVNVLAGKYGKKKFMVWAFLVMAVVFLLSWFLGKFPFSNTAQAYILIILFSIPVAFLGILPNAVLADIAEYDAQTTGSRQEGMFFASRTLLQKLGQSFGVFIFAALTTFGKDIGDDLGIRLSAIFGALLCFFAAVYFAKYDEKTLLSSLNESDYE